MKGDPLRNFFKVSMSKKNKGDPLVSPGTVLRGKTGKIFLVQFGRPNVHFDTIKFRGTSLELFWSVRVD